MKKKKINFAKYADMHDEKEVEGRDGTVITVRNHIPYRDKVQMAQEVVENCVMIHDDSCCYENYGIYAEKIRAMVKYYTNVPVDDAEAGAVVDFLLNNELMRPVMEFIADDYCEAEEIFSTMIEAVETIYTDDASMKKAIKTSFGFLFNGEDITQSLAKAEAMRDTMYKALDALNQKEKEAEENMDNGKLKLGGNIINFARRE